MATMSLANCVLSSSASFCSERRSASISPSCSSNSKAFCGLRPVSGLPVGFSSRIGRGKARVVCAVGDVSPEGTTYLIAGAVAVAILGTAYPLLFSRKDLCPECDGAGFIRKTGQALRANAARKDSVQIVCPTCNGLGKLGQIDK